MKFDTCFVASAIQPSPAEYPATASVQKQLAELGDIFRSNVEAESACAYAAGHSHQVILDPRGSNRRGGGQ